MEQKFGIVLTAKMRHGALWEIVKRFGGNAALARQLGMNQAVLGNWVNLKAAPSFKWLATARGQTIMDALFLLGGKTAEELWPIELRAAIKGGEIGKRIERHQEVAMAQLAYRAEERLMLPSPESELFKQEAVQSISACLNRLGARYRMVIVLRYGLEGNQPHTYDEVGKILNVGKQRVRQMEESAIRKLQKMGCELLEEARESLLEQ